MAGVALPSDLLDAALAYAARGWPVFPCNPKNKQPLLAAQKDDDGKPIKGTGGVSAASTDADQVRAWWKRWPKALVGLACGHPTIDAGGMRLFVLDFDPREDPATGEVWTLERLKTETEAQIGCALPPSLTALSPSDGVHLYLLQDDGAPITNRGNLPLHVDVRGLGGYVIAPPSVMAPDAAKAQGGLRYRWHRREPIGGIAAAPAQLLAVLRDKGGKARPAKDPASPPAPRAPVSADDAVRKYGLTALDNECAAIRDAPSGQRNAQLNTSALKVASLVAAGALDATIARFSIEAAARDNAGQDDERQLLATIDSGWTAGLSSPRDLSDVAEGARRRADRADRPARPAQGGGGNSSGGFRHGRAAGRPSGGRAAETVAPPALEPVDRIRLGRIAQAWFDKGLEDTQRDGTADRAKRFAWDAGRRIAAGLLPAIEAREALASLDDAIPDLAPGDIGRAVDQGALRGFDPAPQLLDLHCARFPLTDFGIGERFHARHGTDFRFTTAKGWLGWDGRRWRVLDQDKDVPPAEIIAAVFDTVRAIQREAARVGETGVRFELIRNRGARGGLVEYTADEDGADPDTAALDRWFAVGKGWKRFSGLLAEFGRKSETAGKPGAIAALAHRWLTVPIEEFDREQMAINCLNGTLRLSVDTDAGGSKRARVSLDPHDRADLITRLAPVDYDRDAECPLYDAMLAWAQPGEDERRYLHQVGGYACSGDTGEHKLWFCYGRGRNGKSTTIDAWCSTLGDYAGTVGIETFLDQGIKKRGDAATPDLAKLGGVRMLRASEPERGAKLNSALIKAATGGEPMSVRALHRGFFDLEPRFKLIMSGNSKPTIPDTDDGIWTRMKLVDWRRNIDMPEDGVANWPKKDPKLLDKIKAGELPGIFQRLVGGLCDYLEQGFTEPDSVTQSTADYRDKSDPLARFLRLCVEVDPTSRVKSSDLLRVYSAWCKAAGSKEWTSNGFAEAMQDKGFTKARSDGMRWNNIRLIRDASDFVDDDGNVRTDLPDLDPPDADDKPLPRGPDFARLSTKSQPYSGPPDDLPI